MARRRRTRSAKRDQVLHHERDGGLLGRVIVTRADLIDELSKAFGFTKRESEQIITTVFETMTEALVRGEKVEIRGFGSLRIRRRKPRAGRNPKTGATVDVPPKRVVKFKVGKELRRSVNT